MRLRSHTGRPTHIDEIVAVMRHTPVRTFNTVKHERLMSAPAKAKVGVGHYRIMGAA